MYTCVSIREIFSKKKHKSVLTAFFTGYNSTFASQGILTDYSTPGSDYIHGELPADKLSKEECESYVPSKYHYKCIEQTPLDNFR